MKKIVLIIFSCLVLVTINTTPSGIVLQQQISPLHNLLHVELSLTNADEETFDNVNVTVALPEDLLYFIRSESINSGDFGVSGDFYHGGQTVTWTTGNSSVTTKHFHFLVFSHTADTYQLTAHVIDNQGVPHAYQSNSQILAFPQIGNAVFVIAKNSSLQFNAIDDFNLTPPATSPIKVAIRPNASHGTASPSSTTTTPFTITYTPATDFVGYDYFTVQGIDINGDTDGESVLVVVGVEDDPNGYAAFLRKTYNANPKDNAPGAKDFTLQYSVDGGDIPVYLIDYSLDLFNAAFPIVYTMDATDTTYGTATLTPEGVFRYFAGSVTGVDTISYRVTDANNRFADAIITINVVPSS